MTYQIKLSQPSEYVAAGKDLNPDINRDVIVRYIVQEGTINPSADAYWSFAPMVSTSAACDTGPEGFARYRILL